MKSNIKLFILIFYFSVKISLVNAQAKNSDNREILNDSRINPQFAQLIKLFLDSAEENGFKPFINQGFRTKEEAEIIARRNKKLSKPAAEISMHSFGIACDIWLKNDKDEVFSFDTKEYEENPNSRFSYSKWIKFIKIGENFGLINGKNHNDTDHWEYHPNWKKDDWVSAKEYALPIYKKYRKLDEIEILHKIWENAGLSY